MMQPHKMVYQLQVIGCHRGSYGPFIKFFSLGFPSYLNVDFSLLIPINFPCLKKSTLAREGRDRYFSYESRLSSCKSVVVDASAVGKRASLPFDEKLLMHTSYRN